MSSFNQRRGKIEAGHGPFRMVLIDRHGAGNQTEGKIATGQAMVEFLSA